ncbi:MAG: DNA topoisomerase IB [Chitinophagales bacterium]
MIATAETTVLPAHIIKKIGKDPLLLAKKADLIYVSDSDPGIVRIRKGQSFSYQHGNSKVKDAQELQRIKKLVIPPAWENVWICKLENGHLQVTGYDIKKRKQYRYHPLWNALRDQTKYYRLEGFGNILPHLRLQIEKDLSLPDMPQEKILAAVVSLMERTTIRVGNAEYEKLYGSFGLTTMKDKHVEISGSNVKFTFKGKKGIHHHIGIKSKRLSDIVKQCRDIPGKELFQYYDDAGTAHSIDSGMLNEYIRKLSGGDYTSKDFRTWAGTVRALLAFKELGPAETVTESKRKIVEALDQVSVHLGNTRTVCKKYYVHPAILALYEKNSLNNYLDQLDKIEHDDGKAGLTPEEKILMKIIATDHS